MDVRQVLHSAVFQEIFKTEYAIGQVAHRQSWNVGRIVGHFVLEALHVAMEMRTRQALAWTVWRIWRVAMGRSIQVQASQDEDFPSTRLVLQPGAVSVATLKIEQELFAAVY
ncbi:MAG TPA: hypothetical protein VI136_17905 [Verrucomicrobiae bacterium]